MEEVGVPDLSKVLLQGLYKSGLSLADIAKYRKISVHKVTYWMAKYGIPRRTRSEAGYVKHNPDGDPFKIIEINTTEKAELLALGVGLYLGEGTKRGQNGVRLVNSDPEIIKLFLRFLKEICGVEICNVKAWINIFDDSVYKESLDYWALVTGIPKSNFYLPTVRVRRSGNYKNKSKYGTITVIVSNTKLFSQIMTWCNDYKKRFADVAQW